MQITYFSILKDIALRNISTYSGHFIGLVATSKKYTAAETQAMKSRLADHLKRMQEAATSKISGEILMTEALDKI